MVRAVIGRGSPLFFPDRRPDIWELGIHHNGRTTIPVAIDVARAGSSPTLTAGETQTHAGRPSDRDISNEPGHRRAVPFRPPRGNREGTAPPWECSLNRIVSPVQHLHSGPGIRLPSKQIVPGDSSSASDGLPGPHPIPSFCRESGGPYRSGIFLGNGPAAPISFPIPRFFRPVTPDSQTAHCLPKGKTSSRLFLGIPTRTRSLLGM